MPKTEVILTHNIVGLGAESDHVKVAAGYARNYLFPQGFAIPLTAANKRRIEALRQRRAEREAHEFNTMSELAKSINKLICIVKVKTGDDGKMFGTVTSGSISDELKHQFEISLDKRKIHIEHPLRTLGEHEVELRLHPEVATTLKLRVESSTPLPQPAETPEARAPGKEFSRGQSKEGAPVKTEKRGRHPEAKAAVEPKAEREAKSAKADKAEKERKPARTEKGEKAK
ncbi:MAG: 50S ribosomal protein L9 [Verrucomicrobia bacterium]|nr:MAG: 50S ribosomal protein L9 [Verrucomicrobiota bacterium]